MAVPKDPRPEQERVTEAYENISRRLEQLKSDDEEELDTPKRQSDDEDEDVAPNSKFEEIENERELEIVEEEDLEEESDESKGSKVSKDKEQDDEDELDSLDDEDEDEEVEETPLQKKGDKLERDEDAFDDVEEETPDVRRQTSEDLEAAPQETLSQRGEKLREAESAEDNDSPDREDKYQWRSFQKDGEDAPEKLDDLAVERPDVSRQISDEEDNSRRDIDPVERPTSVTGFSSEEEDMPIPKIHHGATVPLSGLGGEDRKGGLSNRPTYGQDIRPSFGADYNNPRQELNMNSKPKSSKWHLTILCLIGLVVIGATVYLLKNQFGGTLPGSATPSPSAIGAVSTPEPTPTPLPELERSEFKIRVLNGTGTTDLAKEVMDKLTELGYESERTGNATNSAFTSTLVRVKEGTDSAALSAQVIKDLSPDYSATAGDPLKANDPADVEVILGK